MTLRVIEGWDYFPTNPVDALLGATGWSDRVDLISCPTVTAFDSGRSMAWTGAGLSNNNRITKFMRGRWSTPYVFGIRLNIPTDGVPPPLSTAGVYVLGARDTSSTRPTQWQLNFDQFGVITLISRTEGVASIFARTSPWAFVPGNWFYMEVKVTPGYTDGALEIRVNTVPVLSLVNIRTSDGSPVLPETLPGITHLFWENNPIQGESLTIRTDYRSDDLYFLTADGAQNNDYLGNVRVRYMPVIGNSTPLNWSIGGTSPAPTNWQSVLNTNISDSQFVFSNNPGDEDFYQIDPILNTPTVFGIELGGAYRQDDATQRFVANQIKSGATISEGSHLATNQSYTFSYDIYELNPDTGVGWTGAEVNAVEIGPKVIS